MAWQGHDVTGQRRTGIRQVRQETGLGMMRAIRVAQGSDKHAKDPERGMMRPVRRILPSAGTSKE